MERARHVLARQRLGSIKAPADLVISSEGSGSAYQRALVRQVGGKLEIVGIVNTSEAELQQDVFRLVPAEAPLARRKLMDKAYYSLFRAAEIAFRFMDTPKDEKPSKNLRKAIERYLPEAGLEISKNTKGRWTARTISTQPSFIVAELDLADDLDALGTGPFLFAYGGIKRLIDNFPFSEVWDVRKRLPAGSNQTDTAGDGEVLLDDLPSNRRWRRLNPKFKSVAAFRLSQSRLLELSRWPNVYRDATLPTGSAGFPKQLQLSIKDGELVLSFPGHARLGHSDLAALNSTQRELHELRQRQLGQLHQPTTLPEHHWLQRTDLLAIARLSSDYGLSFAAELRSIADGLCLRLVDESGAIQLNVPLAVSLAGDYAAIVI